MAPDVSSSTRADERQVAEQLELEGIRFTALESWAHEADRQTPSPDPAPARPESPSQFRDPIARLQLEHIQELDTCYANQELRTRAYRRYLNDGRRRVAAGATTHSVRRQLHFDATAL